MTFHKDLWIAAAAAAPIIALANQVTLSDSVGMISIFSKAKDDNAEGTIPRDHAIRGQSYARAAYFISYLNMLGQGLVLGAALFSLGDGTDLISGSAAGVVVTAAECAGIVAIALTSVLSGFIRSRRAALGIEG